MAEVRIAVEVPGTEVMQRKLAARPRLVLDAMVTASRKIGQIIVGRAQVNVSGRFLRVQTGTLRGRIHAPAPTVEGNTVKQIIADPVEYGPVHEYGFRGPVTVRQHQRLVRQVFGRPLKSSLLVTVRQHSRLMNMPERPFMRTAAHESIPDMKRVFTDQLGQAINRAAAESVT